MDSNEGRNYREFEVTVEGLQPGDRIKDNRYGEGYWATVARIEPHENRYIVTCKGYSYKIVSGTQTMTVRRYIV